MKVLFAIGQSTDTTIQDKILNKYEQLYGESFTYECEYYVDGVIKYLSENEVDVLVLNELLENEPVDIQTIDNITDRHPDLKVILGLDDKHKEDEFPNKLYAIGVYDCLFFSDFLVDNLIELFRKGRTKKQAKDYYEIEDSNSIDIQFQVTPITEEVLMNTINTLKESIENGTLNEIFAQVDKEFTQKEMCYLLTVLPVNILDKLKESEDSTYKKYYEIIQNEIEQTDQEEEKEVIEVTKYVERPVQVKTEVVEKIKKVEVIKKINVEKEKPVIVEKEVYKVNQVRYESVIAVVSNCPTGKSFLSWNLAYALSANYDVAVVCMDDFSMANAYFGTIDEYPALSEIDEKSIQQIVEEGISITDKITLYSGEFGSKAEINKNLFNQLISTIHSNNNIVILDAATGYNKNLPKVIKMANDILVVYTMSNGHIRLNNMLLEQLDEELYGKNMIAVINNVNKESKEFSSCKTYLKKSKMFNNVVEVSHCGNTTFDYINSKTCNYLADSSEFSSDIDVLINSLRLQGKDQQNKRTKKSILNIFRR